MNTRIKRRGGFCPSITEAKLEERIALSSASTVTPPPAPPPFISGSNLENHFNNGFVGFGSAPSALNTNFGTGINTPVSSVSHRLYLGMISTSGGVPFILR